MSAAGCGRSSAARAQRDCPAAPPEVESPVPRGPYCVACSTSSPALAAVFCPRGAPFCCISTFSFGPALWWRAAARAMRTVCCSCRSIERSRRSRRRRAAPEGCPLSSAMKKSNTRENKGSPTCLSLVVVELDAHLCRYTSVGAPSWCGRTPASQTPGVPATLGLNVQMDGGRKMLQNCSKLPLIAAAMSSMHSCNCAYLSLWRLKCPLTPAMN